MHMKPSNGEPAAEVLRRAARIRDAIEEEREQLLRSIAGLVAGTEERRSWAEIRESAEDLLGEATGEALAHAANFDPKRRPGAWVRGIAARLLLSRRRQRARSRRCVSATVLGEEGWERALAQLCDAPADDEVARRLDLRQALDRLPAEDRLVLELRYYRDLSADDLARELGLPTPGSARVRLCRALQALRARFHAEEEERP
jgi:RNA polymerase sigma factor (sigma-70 family)